MFKFFRTAIFNGLLIILPLLFLVIILKEFIELIIGLATPIADLLPMEFIDTVPETEVLAALLIFFAALIVGILSLIPFGASIGRFFERHALNKLPVYQPLKTLLHALLGSEKSNSFKPAFIQNVSGVMEPAYIVEDTGRPRVIVLVPWTPASFAGSLRLVPREQVFPLDLSLDEFSLAIGHYGVGLSSLLPELPEEQQDKPGQD
jgi:uncharacterized membrane protein